MTQNEQEHVHGYDSDDMGDFDSRFWTAVKGINSGRYPRKRPDNMTREQFEEAKEDLVESGDAESYSDAADMLYVPDDESAREQAEELFNFLDRSWRDTVIVVPGWWAGDDMGEWAEVWVGKCEGLTRSGKALKMENLIPYKDRNEDRYFQTEIDFNTVPVSDSILKFAARVTKPEPDDQLLVEWAGDTPKMWRGTLSEADFSLTYTKTNEPGQRRPRVAIDFPAPWESDDSEAMLDDFKDLEWAVEDEDGDYNHEHSQSTHKDFDEHEEVWFVDEKSANYVIEFLAKRGWTVGVARMVENRINPFTEEKEPQEPDSALWENDDSWPAPGE